MLSLKFLQEKISKLQTALFFNNSCAVLKIPTSIICVLKVDDAGQIWFCLPAPQHAIDILEKNFFSELQFFRKGKNFYLKIIGKGIIVNDPEEVNDLEFLGQEYKNQVAAERLMLIKVIIQAADYFENKLAIKKAREVKFLQSVKISNPFNTLNQFLKRQIFPEHHHQVV